MLTSLLSWGFRWCSPDCWCARWPASRPGMDYRAAGAAAYLGLGAVWAMG
jgi:short-chain fatty acids transporter